MRSLVLAASLTLAACLPHHSVNPDTAEEAILRGKELACVMTSEIADPREVAKVCGFVDQVLPFVLPILRDLISVRDAAKRSGVVYGQRVGQ